MMKMRKIDEEQGGNSKRGAYMVILADYIQITASGI
jgi:hypothetical protein